MNLRKGNAILPRLIKTSALRVGMLTVYEVHEIIYWVEGKKPKQTQAWINIFILSFYFFLDAFIIYYIAEHVSN